MRGLTRLILLVIVLLVGWVAHDRHHHARDLEARLQIATENAERFERAYDQADAQVEQLRTALADLERGLSNVQTQLAAREAELIGLRMAHRPAAGLGPAVDSVLDGLLEPDGLDGFDALSAGGPNGGGDAHADPDGAGASDDP